MREKNNLCKTICYGKFIRLIRIYFLTVYYNQLRYISLYWYNILFILTVFFLRFIRPLALYIYIYICTVSQPYLQLSDLVHLLVKLSVFYTISSHFIFRLHCSDIFSLSDSVPTIKVADFGITSSLDPPLVFLFLMVSTKYLFLYF